MDKEKQIEEIKRDIAEFWVNGDFDKVVEEFINLGYRKISENEVVISKEEYEGLINQNKGLKEENHTLWLENNDIEAQVELKSKETAREIFNNMLDGEIGGKYPCKIMSIKRYNELAKEFGVEIKE